MSAGRRHGRRLVSRIAIPASVSRWPSATALCRRASSEPARATALLVHPPTRLLCSRVLYRRAAWSCWPGSPRDSLFRVFALARSGARAQVGLSGPQTAAVSAAFVCGCFLLCLTSSPACSARPASSVVNTTHSRITPTHWLAPWRHASADPRGERGTSAEAARLSAGGQQSSVVER